MPTIKTKKEMNLPELIEWGWKNEIEKRSFISNDGKVTAIFEDMGRFITDSYISKDVTFTVEIEQEITEVTVIPKIAKLNLCGYDQHEELFVNENKSIKQLLSEVETNNKAFYIMNDDLTMTLIWKNGKMVE